MTLVEKKLNRAGAAALEMNAGDMGSAMATGDFPAARFGREWAIYAACCFFFFVQTFIGRANVLRWAWMLSNRLVMLCRRPSVGLAAKFACDHGVVESSFVDFPRLKSMRSEGRR